MIETISKAHLKRSPGGESLKKTLRLLSVPGVLCEAKRTVTCWDPMRWAECGLPMGSHRQI